MRESQCLVPVQGLLMGCTIGSSASAMLVAKPKEYLAKAVVLRRTQVEVGRIVPPVASVCSNLQSARSVKEANFERNNIASFSRRQQVFIFFVRLGESDSLDACELKASHVF